MHQFQEISPPRQILLTSRPSLGLARFPAHLLRCPNKTRFQIIDSLQRHVHTRYMRVRGISGENAFVREIPMRQKTKERDLALLTFAREPL